MDASRSTPAARGAHIFSRVARRRTKRDARAPVGLSSSAFFPHESDSMTFSIIASWHAYASCGKSTSYVTPPTVSA
jgi:hypothetical protein